MTPIEEKYNFLLYNIVNLGLPIGNEESLYDGGKKQLYQFGNIYYHPRVTTAFECHGLILQKYIELNEEKSGLGYPITDEVDNPAVPGGKMNIFENGTLFWEQSAGVTVEFDEKILIPQVIVKIEDHTPINLGQGETLSLDQFSEIGGVLGGAFILGIVRNIFPDLVFRRLFDSLSSVELQSIVNQAKEQDTNYNPPNFENFLEIDCPEGFDTEPLVDALSQWTGIIEYAYTAPIPSDPQVVGTTNPFFKQQGYLDTAPIGISVQAAWAKGADGDGTRFIDLEQGWFLGHEDLPSGIQLLEGTNSRKSFPHGAAVLGEIVGVDNNIGIVGIAPKANARVISYFTPGELFNTKKSKAAVANMIMKATSALWFGDVLLLEVQFETRINNHNSYVPVEVDPAVFEAIRLATKFGVIVVEAAGNSGVSLDDFKDKTGKKVLSRNTPTEFKDSGAIMVGACSSAYPHTVLNTVVNKVPLKSNFGSRVDCFAWGENILTTGNENHPDQRNAYMNRPFFGGTSGAAPIIVGVCLLLQNLRLKLTSRSGTIGKLGPYHMRRILSNQQNGTDLIPAQNGVMPDLKKIINNEFI